MKFSRICVYIHKASINIVLACTCSTHYHVLFSSPSLIVCLNQKSSFSRFASWPEMAQVSPSCQSHVLDEERNCMKLLPRLPVKASNTKAAGSSHGTQRLHAWLGDLSSWVEAQKFEMTRQRMETSKHLVHEEEKKTASDHWLRFRFLFSFWVSHGCGGRNWWWLLLFLCKSLNAVELVVECTMTMPKTG